MTRKKSGYDGPDSMREKAERLFGDAIKTSMADVPSASAPSKTPMRKYAAGGKVVAGVKKGAYEHTGHATGKRTGTMLPKTAKEPVEDADLTDLHMPRKLQSAEYKKGGAIKKNFGGAMHQLGTALSSLPIMRKQGGAAAELKKALKEAFKKHEKHEKEFNKEKKYKKGGEVEKEPEDKEEYKKYMRERAKKGKESIFGAGHEEDMRKAGLSEKEKELARKRAYKIHEQLEKDEKEPEHHKYGGRAKAKVTSNLRQAIHGKVKTEPRGEERDVGSIKQIPDRKQKSMLHPKPASNGSKHSKLNVESMKEFAKLKHGGKTTRSKK